MKQERVILSFIAVLIGLLVAGAAFYFYQSTKIVSPGNGNRNVNSAVSPTPKPTIFLTVDSPSNEAVVGNKTLTIIGRTAPEATVIIITDSGQEVIQPSTQGNYSTTLTLESGQNVIHIQAVAPNGETTTVIRTITYSTDDF